MHSFVWRLPQAIGRCVARFRADRAGNVAIVVGLLSVVLMLAIGAAVDIARWLNARDSTVAGIDAAVLAGGRVLQTGGTDTDAVAAAKKYYDENVKSRLPIIAKSDTVSFAVKGDGMGVKASGTAYIDTPFLAFTELLGAPAIDKPPLISPSETNFAESQIAVGGNGGQSVEVSLILDITGSMSGSKIQDLRDAAKLLVNTVIWEDQSEFTAKVALVPYSIGVNVGNYANTVRGTIKSGTATTPGSNKYKFTNASNSSQTFTVSTCVTERTGTYKYKDDPPTTAKVGLNYPATSNPCPTAKLVPLSSNKTTLTTAIDTYAAAGSTAGQIGLAWGWYTLSPKWNTVFTGDSAPASYSKLTELGPKGQPLLKKIALLMTDGDFNTSYCNGVIAKDAGTGSGASSDHINCNSTNGSSNSQALSLCSAMKTAGITVYTIGFDVSDQNAARTLMTQCATDSSKVYIAADGDELKHAFLDIALKLSSLYLSH